MGRFVVIAEVVKAVGLKGEVKLYPLLDFHEPLLQSGVLTWRTGEPLEIQRYRPAKGCVVAKTTGTDDRDAADGLIGREIGFDSERYADPDFPRPAGGLPFRYLDRVVVTRDGETVGTVEEVRWTGSQYTLVLGAAAGKHEILIPAVAPILEPDDGLDGPLVIDPPEGLLDVQSS